MSLLSKLDRWQNWISEKNQDVGVVAGVYSFRRLINNKYKNDFCVLI